MLRHLTTPLLAAALAAAPLALAAQDITLRAVASSNTEDEDYDGLVVFKNFVESASNGAIAVELFIGTQLCSAPAECLQGVADGTLDIHIGTTSGAANIFPYVQVLDLPYLMSDDRVAEAVLDNDSQFVNLLQQKILEDSGGTIRLMTIGNTGGWRNFANTERRIEEPEDLAGLKIRTVVADLPQELVKALNASPTPIAWPELFTSLQTNVVEGTKNGITDIMNMRFPEAGLKYMTLDGHAYMGAMWFMNNARFTALTPELQRVVLDGFYALQQATFASPKRKSIAAYETFVAEGGDLYVPTPEQKEAFREAAAPVYEWFNENVDGGEEVLAALVASVAEAEAKIEATRAVDME